MTETQVPPEAVGWVDRATRESLEPYAWTVRCPEHPPAEPERWAPLTAAECQGEVGGCTECGKFLV
jgi:hypothetical protein